MCQIIEATRAFVLKPDMLEHQGTRLSIAKEFERIQAKYDNELEICMGKDGGFIIFLPSTFSEDDLLDATFHLTHFLDVSPSLICRTHLY